MTRLPYLASPSDDNMVLTPENKSKTHIYMGTKPEDAYICQISWSLQTLIVNLMKNILSLKQNLRKISKFAFWNFVQINLDQELLLALNDDIGSHVKLAPKTSDKLSQAQTLYKQYLTNTTLCYLIAVDHL